jgi:hypothetical protein
MMKKTTSSTTINRIPLRILIISTITTVPGITIRGIIQITMGRQSTTGIVLIMDPIAHTQVPGQILTGVTPDGQLLFLTTGEITMDTGTLITKAIILIIPMPMAMDTMPVELLMELGTARVMDTTATPEPLLS